MLVSMLSFSIWGCHHTFLIRRNFTLTAWLHVEKKNQINTYKCRTPWSFAGPFQSSYYILKCSAVLSLSAYPGRTPRKEGELPAKTATASEAKSRKAKGSTERPKRAVPKLDLNNFYILIRWWVHHLSTQWGTSSSDNKAVLPCFSDIMQP